MRSPIHLGNKATKKSSGREVGVGGGWVGPKFQKDEGGSRGGAFIKEGGWEHSANYVHLI